MVRRIAMEITERNRDPSRLALVGIHTRGVPLARRILAALPQGGPHRPRMGSLDITLHRDDFDRPSFDPEVRDSDLSFDITGLNVVLVDDVLHTGRTIRAAIDELMDFGRPAQIQLAVLVDREGRELPIAPTFVGQRVATRSNESIRVRLGEVDPGPEAVYVVQRGAGGPQSNRG